ARQLAARLNCDWIDADDVIEREAGKTIAEIFAGDGEAVFRELEAYTVAGLSRERRMVVALGGGAVMRAQNRAALTAAGPVVWLTAGVDTILERLAADP